MKITMSQLWNQVWSMRLDEHDTGIQTVLTCSEVNGDAESRHIPIQNRRVFDHRETEMAK